MGNMFLFPDSFGGDANPKNKKNSDKKNKKEKTKTNKNNNIFRLFGLGWGARQDSQNIFFCLYLFCFSNGLLFSAFWACVCFLFSGGGPVCDFF